MDQSLSLASRPSAASWSIGAPPGRFPWLLADALRPSPVSGGRVFRGVSGRGESARAARRPRSLLPAGYVSRAHCEQFWIANQWIHRIATLFWIGISDNGLRAVAWIGAAISLLVLRATQRAGDCCALDSLHLHREYRGSSGIRMGGRFNCSETGFLAIFLCRDRVAPISPACSAGGRDVAVSLAHLPDHARAGPHQIPRRRLLARSHMPLLSL